MKVQIAAFLSSLLLVSCLKDKPLKLPNTGFTPVRNNDDWSISSLKSENLDSSMVVQAYNSFYSESELPMAKSLIVIRNGKIVAEAYAKDKNDINQIDNIQSCTKSVLSLLVGITINKGNLANLNAPLYEYYPEFFDGDIAKKNITIRNCLTMEAGLDFKGGDDTQAMVHTKGSSLEYILKQPLVSQPGKTFLYSDFAPQLISGVVRKANGKSVEEFTRENLFNRLGITNYKWEAGSDGLNFGGFSLYLRPRDLAKLGQLCVDNGVWKGTPIVSNWLAQATVKQAQNTSYGYFFWLDPARNAYSMQGNGRQYVFICPQKNLVIVHTAFPYTNISVWGNLDPVIDLIYRACK